MQGYVHTTRSRLPATRPALDAARPFDPSAASRHSTPAFHALPSLHACASLLAITHLRRPTRNRSGKSEPRSSAAC